MDMIQADNEAELAEIIRAGRSFELKGGGSKLGLGQGVQAEQQLSLAGLRGVTLYEPAELVMSARAATPLAEIEALLQQNGQALAFEPPDYRHLWGGGGLHQTIGGIVATNLAGPRRIAAGSVRDHVLGLRAVNGRGEIFRAGGRVVKNVTGYDLCKLLTGSYGSMAAFTEITFKILPAPESEETIAISGLGAAEAVPIMNRALGSAAAISGAAWLPADDSVTALRLEGFAASVKARAEKLLALLPGDLSLTRWSGQTSRSWWQKIRDLEPFAPRQDAAIWRISVAATEAPALLRRFEALPGFQPYLDWGGALLWLALDCGDDAQAGAVRAMLPPGAQAMLLRAPDPVRARVAIFQPQPKFQAQIEEKLRLSFDPERKLNPGRMTPPRQDLPC